MTEKLVWLCEIFTNESLTRGWRPIDRGESDTHPLSEAEITAYSKIERGEKVGKELLPKQLFVPKHLQRNLSHSNHLMCSGFFIVSKKCAEVLKGFDLGESSFSPVELFFPDKKTLLDEGYSIFNVVGRKASFLPGSSKGMMKIFDPDKDRWMPRGSLKSDQLQFDESALAGQDIWMEAALENCFLISDRLAEGLKSSGLFKSWHLKRCQLVI